MDVLYTILRIAGILGIIAYGCSVSSSLESIAKDLKRLANSRDPSEASASGRGPGSGESGKSA
jgi:hypothetical protein